MRFGVREICDVVFKPLAAVDIGNQHFDAMQPVLYLDTAKTSSLEGAATTVYAQGGQGNPRLIGWDGEKTITFTIEDALMSPMSFHVLSGAGIVKGAGAKGANGFDNTDGKQKIYVHQTYDLIVEAIGEDFYARLPYDVRNGATLIATKEAPIFATILDSAGAQSLFLSAITDEEIFVVDAGDSEPGTKASLGPRGVIPAAANKDMLFKLEYTQTNSGYTDEQAKAGQTVRIDCYAVFGEGAQELQIDAKSFAGYYYIEASTLFRDEATGQDFPAEFIIPRGKIQSNFTFTMAASGDPSTFTFTIDAFPAYTKFDKTKKVMAALQIIDPSVAAHNYPDHTILGHNTYRDDKDSEEYYDAVYGQSIFGSSAEDSDEEEVVPNP